MTDAPATLPVSATAADSGKFPATLTETVFRLCATIAPVPGHAALLDALRREGGPEFVPRLSRGGWFRPGRILDASGATVADDALAWLEQAWAECSEDGDVFLEHHADAGLTVTLEQGVSHYFVAPWGSGPADYLQLEIEELQEVASHRLTAITDTPATAEALLDRPADSPPPLPLGPSRYNFRRLVDIAAYLGRMAEQSGKPAPVLRFLGEWQASSAGQQTRFCDRWVLALSEHLDRYRQTRYAASPVAVHPPAWSAPATPSRGTALAQQLHEFDRAAGYGFAWYFHLLAGRRVPRNLTAEVFADLADGLAYLPERDAALVRQWMHQPYAL